MMRKASPSAWLMAALAAAGLSVAAQPEPADAEASWVRTATAADRGTGGGVQAPGEARFNGRGRPVPGANAPSGQRQQGRQGARIYTVPTVISGDRVLLGGTVIPYKDVKLSAQIPGEVVYVAGEEGSSFDKDEVIVAIDDSQLLAKRRKASAKLQNALTVLRNARVQYGREFYAPRSESPSQTPGMGMPKLWDQMFTRPFGDMMGYGNPDLERSANLYSASTKVGKARARVREARSAIEMIDAKLRDTRSHAPFDGLITSKSVEVGDTVQPGQPLVRYADTTYLRLKVDVPVRLASGLETGMHLPVRIDVGDTRVQGRVAQIYPIADPQQHTVTVKIDLPKDTPGGPGMYAEVLVPDPNAPKQRLPVVPQSAITWRGSLPSVWVVNDQGRAELNLVRLGESAGGGNVTVLSGLQQGQRVLVNPPPGITSGWQVYGNAN
jgi:multidrug efflux pump subunit AcrA (membrane-fusion protein)